MNSSHAIILGIVLIILIIDSTKASLTTGGICCGAVCIWAMAGAPACIVTCAGAAVLCKGPCGDAVCNAPI